MSKNKYKVIKISFIAATWLFLAFLVVPNAWASEITVDKVITLVNQNRLERNLDPLVINNKLSQVAEAKAHDMINNDYFAHTSPAGVDPWHWFGQGGYDYQYAGENLAMDFLNAEREQKAWMDSPTHQKNILNEKFQETGVAVRQGKINGKITTLVVQVFGSRTNFVKADIPKTEPVLIPIVNKNILVPAVSPEKDLIKTINLNPSRKASPDWNVDWIITLSYVTLWSIIIAVNPLIVAWVFYDFLKKKYGEAELVPET
ncbi:MAG: CAP domain-containing protein [Candidatus Moranbacteria bacterium]|nr:CAP domain-containing protein [Candidatus Moranbacteria bacterium]